MRFLDFFRKKTIIEMNPIILNAKELVDLNKTNRLWSYIILHHSSIIDGKINDWDVIKKWHMGLIGDSNPKSKNYNKYTITPMRDIAYNFGIEYENGKLIYRQGRSLSIDGAHTLGKNKIAIGICIVGNFDKCEPDESQYYWTACLCKYLEETFNIIPENLKGHRDYANKSCPGKLFNIDYIKEKIIKL